MTMNEGTECRGEDVTCNGEVDKPAIQSGCSLTLEHVEAMIQAESYTKIGEKTTCGLITLTNGFEICETAACVDPANYCYEVGKQICRERILKKIWELEGYKLQCEMAVR